MIIIIITVYREKKLDEIFFLNAFNVINLHMPTPNFVILYFVYTLFL